MRFFIGVLVLTATVQARAASVLVVAENDLAREAASEMLEPFATLKLKVKLAGAQAPATQCLQKSPLERPLCLAQAGETAFVDAVLQIGATASKGRTSVTLSLLSLDDGKLIKREVVTGPSNKLGASLKVPSLRLGKLIRPASAPPVDVVPPSRPPKPDPVKPEPVVVQEPVAPVERVRVDAPVEMKVTPTPAVVAPVVAEPPAKGSGLRLAAWTSTGLAVVGTVAAVTFGILGATSSSTLDANEGGVSALTRSGANQLAQQANSQFTFSLATGIGAGVLAILSAILWSQS